jgi:hypothetical protein
MRLRTAAAVLLLSLPVLLYGCGGGDDGCSVDDEFPCCALVLVVPDSIDAGETIDASVSGFAGAGCDHFDRIDHEMVARNWVLRPIARRGRAPAGSNCTREMVLFESTVTLAAPVSAGLTSRCSRVVLFSSTLLTYDRERRRHLDDALDTMACVYRKIA